MNKTYKSLGDIIGKEAAFDRLRKAVKKSDVVDRFGDILPDLVKVAKPVKVEKKTLFLRVENSVWRSELNFRQAIIIAKINNYFNEKIISKIKFLA